jgi:putative ABC transport system permease protein
VDADQPVFSVLTMEEVLAESRWPYRVFGSMFALFAVIALVLSTVGIYAVTSYAVSQRVQEIGVRMALGAQPRQVSWLILRSGLTQLAIALVLGLPGAWGVSQALASVVAQISPTDPGHVRGHHRDVDDRHDRRLPDPVLARDEVGSAYGVEGGMTDLAVVRSS